MYFFNQANQTKPMLTEHNKVIVNIWFPKVDGVTCSIMQYIKLREQKESEGADTSRCFMGHVTLKTRRTYASWWPDQKSGEGIGLFQVIDAEKGDYVHDVISEGGVPDLRVCFYSLNIGKIEACYDNIEKTNQGYVIAGNKKVTRLFNEKIGQSCCSLAYELLEAGGILVLSNYLKDLMAKWIILTPENFAEFVKNAKKNEWINYPETHQFEQINKEYIPDLDAEKQNCIIM